MATHRRICDCLQTFRHRVVAQYFVGAFLYSTGCSRESGFVHLPLQHLYAHMTGDPRGNGLDFASVIYAHHCETYLPGDKRSTSTSHSYTIFKSSNFNPLGGDTRANHLCFPTPQCFS